MFSFDKKEKAQDENNVNSKAIYHHSPQDDQGKGKHCPVSNPDRQDSQAEGGISLSAELQHVKHPWGPLYDADSEILILGSFPSPKSRETDFFYGHPKNRFWQVLSQLYDEELPLSIEDKKTLLKRHHIALWDVIDECDISGASDASVRNAVPTRIKDVLNNSKIRAVYCNGAKSFELYQKHQLKETGVPAVKLPSTSPANAACCLMKLIEEWRTILL